MDIPTHEQLIERIDAFRARHDNMAESRLGREATGEPGLVNRIRARGNVTLDTLNKLAAYMAEQDGKLNAAAPAPATGNGVEISGPDWPIAQPSAAEAAE